MKKLSLLIMLLLVNISYSQECVLAIEELVLAYEYNELEFESFALQNGYVYNAYKQHYSCENGIFRVQGSNMIDQETEIKDLKGLLYAFTDVELYLKYKEELVDKYEYRRIVTDDGGVRTFAFGTNKPPTSVIYLSTHTIEDTGENFYRIEIL